MSLLYMKRRNFLLAMCAIRSLDGKEILLLMLDLFILLRNIPKFTNANRVRKISKLRDIWNYMWMEFIWNFVLSNVMFVNLHLLIKETWMHMFWAFMKRRNLLVQYAKEDSQITVLWINTSRLFITKNGTTNASSVGRPLHIKGTSSIIFVEFTPTRLHTNAITAKSNLQLHMKWVTIGSQSIRRKGLISATDATCHSKSKLVWLNTSPQCMTKFKSSVWFVVTISLKEAIIIILIMVIGNLIALLNLINWFSISFILLFCLILLFFKLTLIMAWKITFSASNNVFLIGSSLVTW